MALLLKKGADVNTKGSWGRRPLVESSREGDGKAVKMLLEKGAHVNSRDDSGYTALTAAASEGHAAIVTMLLEGGADANAIVSRPIVEGSREWDVMYQKFYDDALDKRL